MNFKICSDTKDAALPRQWFGFKMHFKMKKNINSTPTRNFKHAVTFSNCYDAFAYLWN